MNTRQRWLLLAGCIVFGLLLPAAFLLPDAEPAATSGSEATTVTAPAGVESSAQPPPTNSEPETVGASNTPPFSETPDYGAMLFRTVLALGFVCLLAFVALKWGLGRLYGANQTDDTMSVVSRMRLGPKREVLVARIGPRHLILGSTEQQLSVLGELSQAEAADYFQTTTAGEDTDG